MKTAIDSDIEMDDELPTLLTGLPKSAPPASISNIRAVLSQEAHGTLATRTSDDEGTLLEVDHMILDYLLHSAIATCLDNAHQADTSQVDLALAQVDEFLALFSDRHPQFTFDAELRFRQLLLQLLSLTSQRFVQHNATPPLSSLSALRARNSSRAMRWIETKERVPTADHDISAFDAVLPLNDATILSNRENFLRSLKLPTDASTTDFYGSPESVSLLDLLPLFMRVSAIACETLFGGTVNSHWMRLATQWMQQACLEQYLIYGNSGSDAVDEAFAWGYKRQTEGNNEDDVNTMFEDSEYAKEVEGWSKWKDQHLKGLLLHGDEDVRSHLARLSEANGMREFGEAVVKFLGALAESIEEPVLSQLQKGKLKGMSEGATKEFLEACGVAGGKLAEAP